MTYVIPGTLRNGKRFRLQYADKATALSINLWRGNVWEVNASGRRKRIKSVYN